LLKASIEEEEYEISQRVKLLQDYLAILNAWIWKLRIFDKS
jgi:hypothetical protein